MNALSQKQGKKRNRLVKLAAPSTAYYKSTEAY
jgi:hypothetical protein